MEEPLTIIYANRNKDLALIKASLSSLDRQDNKNFEVIFVDYGSDKNKIPLIHDILAEFCFVKFVPLDVPRLLWNKSKALNVGIKMAISEFIFIADVDLVFHPKATTLLMEVADPSIFNLFTLTYLSDKESKKLALAYDFEKVTVRNFGTVNGMVLTTKEALETINGFDEFFHFYGAEDEDLYSRLENVGISKNVNSEKYFYHQWHETYPASEENVLSQFPRVENIRRINQRHFLMNRDHEITKPLRQPQWGEMPTETELASLNFPTQEYVIPNILAFVEHFLNEELRSFSKGEVVRVEFIEDPYYTTIKHRIKKLLGKQTQPYCSLKQVNDMVLKKIVFQYRNSIYNYKIAEDLKKLIFIIKI